MLHISISKDLTDYLIATIPFISILVALYATWIARRESKVNQNKLRLDLYNKRLEIYNSMVDFYHAIWSYSSVPKERFKILHRKFIKAKLESKFLFEPDVYESLNKIHNNASIIIGIQDHMEEFTADPKVFLETNQNLHKAFEQINHIPEEIAEKLLPYLDFHEIGINFAKLKRQKTVTDDIKENSSSNLLNISKYIEYVIPIFIPACAYFGAYLYEVGFANVFKIPPGLIKVSLFCSPSLLFLLLLVEYCAQKIIKETTASKLANNIFLTIMAIMLLVMFRYSAGFSVFLSVLILLYYLTLILWSNRKPKDLENSFVIYSLFVALLICFFIGDYDAKRPKFPIVSNTNLVVLRIYNDNLICSHYNIKDRTIDGKFVIIDAKGTPQRTLEWRNIGPLHLDPNSDNKSKTNKKR